MENLCKDTMINAYRNISFRMEERGEYDFKYYSGLLEEDLKLLGENSGKYACKFQEKVMTIYHHKSKTASAMVVGPARFKPNTKALDSEQRAYEHFKAWRDRYFRLVNRERKKSPSEDIEAHKQELVRLGELLEKRKLEGFRSNDYRIANVRQRIRYYEQKIKNLEARTKLAENFEETEIPGGRVYFANERLVVEHSNKPSREVIDLIKAHGFRYSPKTKTWVRQFTGEAVRKSRMLVEKLSEHE